MFLPSAMALQTPEIQTHASQMRASGDILSNNNFGQNGSKWTKEHFTNLFTNHRNRGYAGKVIVDDLGVKNIVGKTLSAEELLDVLALARQNPKPGMQKVLNDLCCNTDIKYIGSEYVLRYAKNHWTEIVEFEETVQDSARVIDIVSSVKPYRRELKSWRNFANNYKTRFIKQFVEDLKGIQNLDEMGWYFDLKGDLVDNAKLKAAVLETLSSKEGKEALESLLNSGKLQSLFPNDKIKAVDDFLNKINNEDVFNSIFK